MDLIKNMKLKFVLTTFVLLILVPTMKAQNIDELFLMVPAKYVDDLSVGQRTELLKEKTIQIDDMVYWLTVDRANGYLKMDQTYTEGQSGFQVIEMCYWNYNNKKNKLLAISYQGGNNTEHFQNDLKFFDYANNDLKLSTRKIFDDYSIKFDDMMQHIVSGMISKNTSKDDAEAIRLHFLFALPQNGKNITLSFDDPPEWARVSYPNKVLRKSRTLYWQSNGTFK